MFESCTSLVGAPQRLPATTLVDRCYGSMFSHCESLTVAPDLPAAALPEKCYESMFSGCYELSTVRVWCTSNNGGTSTWLSEAGKNVKARGQKMYLYQLQAMHWGSTGSSGSNTDYGWEVVYMD